MYEKMSFRDVVYTICGVFFQLIIPLALLIAIIAGVIFLGVEISSGFADEANRQLIETYDVPAEVTHMEVTYSKSFGNQYHLFAVAEDGTTISERVASSTYAKIKEGDIVYLRYSVYEYPKAGRKTFSELVYN